MDWITRISFLIGIYKAFSIIIGDKLAYEWVSLPQIAAIRQFDTARLIPSRFAERTDSVLQTIADEGQHIDDLSEMDNAKDRRLAVEFNGLAGMGRDEFVFGIMSICSVCGYSPTAALLKLNKNPLRR